MAIIQKNKGFLIEIPRALTKNGGTVTIIGDELEEPDWCEFESVCAEYLLEFRNGQTKIPEEAFKYDRNLKSVLAPFVKTVDSSAFDSCNQLESASFPEATVINSNVFMSCANLKSIKLEKLEHIGDNALSLCSALERITLPRTLSAIEDGFLFFGCMSLVSIEIENSGMFDICDSALYDKERELLVRYPPARSDSTFKCSAVEIAPGAFSDCNNLVEIILPSVRRIGAFAFFPCENLRRLRVPNLEIEDDVQIGHLLNDTGINDCSRLEVIEISFRNPLFEKLEEEARILGLKHKIFRPIG